MNGYPNHSPTKGDPTMKIFQLILYKEGKKESNLLFPNFNRMIEAASAYTEMGFQVERISHIIPDDGMAVSYLANQS